MSLNTKVGSVELSTPLILASGYITETPDFFMRASKFGCSAIVTRSLKKVVPEERKRVPAPRYAVIPGKDTMLNCEWGNEYSWELWRNKWVDEVRVANSPIIMSLSGRDLDGCKDLIRSFDEIGVDAFEINISCSHSGALHGNLNVDFGNLKSTLKHIRPITKTPIWIKLSYSPFVVGMAQMAEEMGADAIICSNSIGPGMLIDIESGYTKLGTQGGAGGVSGAAIFPIALRCVFEISRNVRIPVVGVGGVCSGEDAIQMMFAGASAVQLYTYPSLHGPEVFESIITEMNSFLMRHNDKYQGISDIIGLSHAHALEHRFHANSPTINSEKCIGCGICVRSCQFNGMKIVYTDGKEVASITESCISCNACVGMCPIRIGAITPNFLR